MRKHLRRAMFKIRAELEVVDTWKIEVEERRAERELQKRKAIRRRSSGYLNAFINGENVY